MNVKRLPRYLRACLRAAVTNGPRAYLKMLSTSPYTVKDLPRYGISMVVDVRDPAISKPILALGAYEDGLAQALLSHAHEGTHFLDIGANIGFFTLAVARRAGRGRVWSVEPDDQNVRLLRASIALNGFEDTVAVHHLAASDTDGEVYFSTLGYEANIGARFTAKEEATLMGRSLAGARKPSKIRARAIDSLLRGEKVDLVKVDVEGHEPAVFAGMRELLRRQRPIVFSEFAPGTIRDISGTDPADLLRLLVSCGYVLAVVEDGGGVTGLGENIAGVLARHEEDRHHLDLMFTPREQASAPPV